MNNLIELAIITLPAVVFITATVLYTVFFRIRTFQGKAMLFLLLSLTTIFSVNVGVNVSDLWFGGVPAWWYGVAVAAFTLITLAGAVLCVSIIRARKKE